MTQVATPGPTVLDALALLAEVGDELLVRTVRDTHLAVLDRTSAGPVHRGIATAVYRGLTYSDTITEHERPSRLTFTVTGRLLSIVARMRFEESGGSTQLGAVFDVQPHGVMKALLPAMAPVVRRDFRQALAGFRRFCESGAGAA